uniref:Uncharacterized protein n=1 Tax=Oryza glumipatula TaxID=40148 RepID=A0A0E0BIE5_9ORYZ
MRHKQIKYEDVPPTAVDLFKECLCRNKIEIGLAHLLFDLNANGYNASGPKSVCKVLHLKWAKP